MSDPTTLIDIKDVLAATDIVSLIRDDIELKKAGKDFQALCPFYDEQTPSFTVSPSKQFYHCFGCQAHGDALTWMVEYRGLPFRQALEQLAREAGIDLTRDPLPLNNGATRERAAKRKTAEIESAVIDELMVLRMVVGMRVAHRQIPNDLRERYPHIPSPPMEPWEREYVAAERIAKALYALYGVRA